MLQTINSYYFIKGEIAMTLLGIRYFFIIFCAIFAYIRILNKRVIGKLQYCLWLSFSFLLSFSLHILSDTIFTFRLPIIFFLFFIFITIYTRIKWHISLIVSILSFALSFIFLALSSFLCSTVIILLSAKEYLLSNTCIFMTGLIQILLLYLVFQIKRLKNGMPFLLHKTFINIGLLISTFVVILFLVLQQISLTNFTAQFALYIIMFVAALALLAWWRFKITQSYRNKLRVSEVESLYREISDKDAEIERLIGNNSYLARVIHKDNKVIPAMELAVRSYLQTAFTMKPEEAKEYGEELLDQLAQMTADRNGIIHNYRNEAKNYRPEIGLYTVDAVILYMEKRAVGVGIEYRYQFDQGLKEVMLSYISEKDVIHLLSDVIENALIATMHEPNKQMKIHIGFIQDILFIDVSDSGIPFEPSTYQNFGMLQHTTHSNSGGSGIGLMDIWKLKKQYKISLQIYEYPPEKSAYTKKIRFLFDRKNHFLIQSYRAKEIKSVVIRNDLHVFPYPEDDN